MSETVSSPQAAPNWYQDPADPRFVRYWDGTQWTGHTAPAGSPQPGTAQPGTAQPVMAQASGSTSKKGVTTLVVVVSAFALLVIIGILAAIAIPVFLNQRAKAQDTAAKADAALLGKEVATWYVDHQGGPPAVTVSGGEYSVDHVAVGAVSGNVQLGGITASGANDWCVWVTNPNGDVKDFQYSAARGLGSGSC